MIPKFCRGNNEIVGITCIGIPEGVLEKEHVQNWGRNVRDEHSVLFLDAVLFALKTLKDARKNTSILRFGCEIYGQFPIEKTYAKGN